LGDGIGDTIRVSLTEDSVHEIPVARALVQEIALQHDALPVESSLSHHYDPYVYRRRDAGRVNVQGFNLGGTDLLRVVLPKPQHEALVAKINGGSDPGEYRPELVAEDLPVVDVDPQDTAAIEALNQRTIPCLVTVADDSGINPVHAFRLLATLLDARHPILLKDTLATKPHPSEGPLEGLLRASAVLGSLICDGIGDAIFVRNEPSPGAALRLGYNILQASGARIFKTDYVACPSCGRTLFNLQETTARIKEATAHLKGVKIAIMGCIVNGPGEMADADFGYVGGAPGKINLYVGKTAVKFNIPEGEAVSRLKDLIAEHGKWVEPASAMQPS
jgi:(E)-4-hydroxy-3-methylbut-2-enyl-diphosphate synthase